MNYTDLNISNLKAFLISRVVNGDIKS